MEILEKLCIKPGVAHPSEALQAQVISLLMPYTKDICVDALGNIKACIQNSKPGKPHLLLQAHIDEIGMFVSHIEPGGFLRVCNCGSIDLRLLPGKEVCIHGERDLFGVVASTPPHLKDLKQDHHLKIDDIFVDTGLSDEEARRLIHPGNPISFVAPPISLLNERISSKALDNRAGAAVIFAILEACKPLSFGCGLSVLFSVQEEVGSRGISPGVFGENYDIAVAFDVSFASSSDLPKYKCKELGGGPMIGVSSTLDGQISERLMRLAEEKNIPYQTEVMGGLTSTDADMLSIAGKGIKTGLCSIPLRYMHTPVEVVQKTDILQTADLLSAFILSVDKEGI